MTDLHKALTDLYDEFASVGAPWVPIHRLRALLAEHPPTAPVMDRELLGSEPDLRQVLAKVIEDAWQRGDSDVDAIIAFLDGGEGS